jgi:hypothetical protein
VVPYATLPSFVLGFHGCDRAVADRVIAGRQRLRASANDYDWLGAGIYFWESDATRTREWAHELRRRGKLDRPAVVGAVIDLGQCLNLLDRQYLKLVASAYRFLKNDAERTGTPLPRNRSLPGRSALLLRDLDCATINVCRELQVDRGLPPFDTVRAAFIEGEPLYPNAGFNDRNHIQLCVVNPRCIKGYFRPLAGVPA